MVRVAGIVALTFTHANVFATVCRGYTILDQPLVPCEGQYPNSIVGNWREDTQLIQHEYLDAFSAVHDLPRIQRPGASISITPSQYIVELGIGQIARPYKLQASSDGRYLLELTDQYGATDVVAITLVPCGLVIENKRECKSAFCLNARGAFYEIFAKKEGLSVKFIRQSIKEAEQSMRFIRYTYFRRVADESPR